MRRGSRTSGRREDERLFAPPHEHEGKSLDPFQQEAIVALLQSMSTLVSAPTGTGKTLIADFLVQRTLEEGRRVFYTAPIKALVNQKHREFAAKFGSRCVGILTGDVTWQKDASVIVMTTEILRNMLLKESGALDRVAWVIFDEIHYIDHAERGAVWEEAILLLPEKVHILGLSATIPNASQLVAWLEHVRQEPVALVKSHARAVPLEHYYFTQETGIVSRDEWIRRYLELRDPDGETDLKGDRWDEATWRRPHLRLKDRRERASGFEDDSSHLDLIDFIARERLFPCIYFALSRRGAAFKAEELAGRSRLLPERQRESVRVTVKRTLEEMGIQREDVPGLEGVERLWYRGIGLHHAGLLPAVRRVTELLLERRILRVVYATETFAVGVNMPVRSVCFDSLEKFDGRAYRLLTPNEYFQMAGRAGRRGLDRRGVAVALLPFSAELKEPPPDWDEARLLPIESRFRLTYNTVINWLERMNDERVRTLLASSFACFPAGTAKRTADDLYREFHRKLEVLERLGHVREGRITEKGRILSELFQSELLLAELIDGEQLERYSPPDLAGLAAAFADEGDEPAPGARRMPIAAPPWSTAAEMAAERVRRLGGSDVEESAAPSAWRAEVVSRWCAGSDLRGLERELGVEAGDVVSLCRRSIDLLRQMAKAAAGKDLLVARLQEALHAVDRGVVRVHLA